MNGNKMTDNQGKEHTTEETFVSESPKQEGFSGRSTTSSSTSSTEAAELPAQGHDFRKSAHRERQASGVHGLSPTVIGLIFVGLITGLLWMNMLVNNDKAIKQFQAELSELESRAIDNEQELNVLRSRVKVMEYETFEALKPQTESRQHRQPDTTNEKETPESSKAENQKLLLQLEMLRNERDELIAKHQKEFSNLEKLANMKDQEIKKLKTQVAELDRQLKSNKVELLRKTKENKLLKLGQGKEAEKLKSDLGTVSAGYLALKEEHEEMQKDYIKVFEMYREGKGDTPLHLAAFFNRQNEIVELVEETVEDVDINARNQELQTPLHRVAYVKNKAERIATIKYLIENGADVMLQDNKKFTFLHELFEEGTTLTPAELHDMAAFLVGKKLTRVFNLPDALKGTTPFQLAVRTMEVEERTLALLYKNGVNFNSLNDYGNSVLIYAAEGRRTAKFMASLVTFGLDWNWGHLNHRNQSLLYIAAEFCNVEAMSFFLARGGMELDINAGDVDGNTPLHAAMFGKKDVFEAALFLLQNGAEAGIANKKGYSPLSFALARDDLKDQHRVVELLKNNL